MLKLIGLVHAPTGTSSADCAEAWQETLTAALVREAGLVGCVVSEMLDWLMGDLTADAAVELWWPDEAAMTQGLQSPALAAALAADAASGAPGTFWTAREMVLKTPDYDAAGLLVDGAGQREGRVKAIGSAYRREDFTLPAFFDYWRDVHAPISASVPGLGAYIVNEVLDRHQGDTPADAFVEQWWEDRETMDAAGDAPELATAWADVPNYAETTGTFWVCREHVLVAPTYDGPGLLER